MSFGTQLSAIVISLCQWQRLNVNKLVSATTQWFNYSANVTDVIVQWRCVKVFYAKNASHWNQSLLLSCLLFGAIIPPSFAFNASDKNSRVRLFYANKSLCVFGISTNGCPARPKQPSQPEQAPRQLGQTRKGLKGRDRRERVFEWRKTNSVPVVT